jgi:hypothetical protein
MRFLAIAALFVCSITAFAQKPCDFGVNVTDSIGTYRATKETLVYEKNFAGNSAYIFNSIAVSDGLPTLNVQFIEKSYDFIRAVCFVANPNLYLKFETGKIVPLLHIPQQRGGSLVRDEKGMNNRVLSGYFVFRKDDADFLKTSPISLMRIKFATDTADYIIRREFNAELDGKTYNPANYFLDFYHCINDSN